MKKIYLNSLINKISGSFKSPELVKRYEYLHYDLQTPFNDNVANNNRQTKDNYLFTVDNSSEANPIDWYNAYLEVNFKVVKYTDGTGITAGANNGNQEGTTTTGHTFIQSLEVESFSTPELFCE